MGIYSFAEVIHRGDAFDAIDLVLRAMVGLARRWLSSVCDLLKELPSGEAFSRVYSPAA
jgi:hypothetical protein